MSTAVASDKESGINQASVEQNYESVLRVKVQAMHAEHGEAHVQKALQEEIAKVKKMETELAKLKKKVSAEATVVEDLQMKIRKANLALKRSEAMCHTLQDTMKRREELTERLRTETEAQRETLRGRVAASIASVQEKNAEKKKIVEELEAENERLQSDVAERKAKFDETYESFKSTISDRDGTFRDMIVECQETATTLEALEAKRLAVRRECTTLNSSKAALEQQLGLYDTQFSHLANATVKRDDVEKVMQKQKEQEDEKIAILNEEKKKTIQLRIQFEKEAQDLRVRLAAVRKETQQLERKKNAVEKKCRAAQQKAQSAK